MKFNEGFIKEIILDRYEKWQNKSENLYYDRYMELKLKSYPSIQSKLFKNIEERECDTLYLCFPLEIEREIFEKEKEDNEYFKLFEELFDKPHWFLDLPLEHVLIIDSKDIDYIDFFHEPVLYREESISNLVDEELKKEYIDKIKQVLIDSCL